MFESNSFIAVKCQTYGDKEKNHFTCSIIVIYTSESWTRENQVKSSVKTKPRLLKLQNTKSSERSKEKEQK